MAAALGAAASLAGLSAGALFAKALGEGMQNEAAADLIQAQLDVGDATMAKIGTASGAAYARAFGDSVGGNMEAAKAAIQAGLLDPNATAAEMQPIIEKLDTVSQLMGEDIPAVARAAGQSVKNGLVTDGVSALDLLAQATKKNLNVSGDLNDSFVEYSTQLRALGLEGKEGWALKELKLRATDGTAAAAKGFAALNVDAERFNTAMNEGGPASRNMLAEVLRNLNQIKDPADRNAAALALFGTKFEDIQGAAFKLNLDTAVQQFGNVAGSVDRASKTIGDNAVTSIQGAKNTIENAATGIENALAQAFGPKIQQAADWFSTHKPEVIGFFTGLADGAFVTADAILAFASGSIRTLADFASASSSLLEPVLLHWWVARTTWLTRR